MCRAFGVDGYDDPRVATIGARSQHRELTGTLMQQCYAAAATMTTADAIGALEANNVPCGVVVSPAELANDPHVQAIGLLEDSVHATAGRLRQPRHPTQFGPHRPPLGGPAPMLGEHTDVILRDLGYDDARIATLRASGVVG
jgi:crotonobetainyl-CoA:carnitine CoA-transferase CaiB-like acyl-CoA transferase